MFLSRALDRISAQTVQCIDKEPLKWLKQLEPNPLSRAAEISLSVNWLQPHVLLQRIRGCTMARWRNEYLAAILPSANHESVSLRPQLTQIV